ncbi:MAG: sensor histidine kinase [Elusimicrobiota bacterium]|nr:MAG: sensor histidine kinase [Elusimicrobiota bacterium]
MAAVTVRDAGPGIPPAETEKIFERFHRTELTRKVKGTGLGLAIVRALAAANGGAVGAGNHPDGGAVLRVSLPLATEARC